MPTGYTAKLMNEGQTFQEFIMACARAFGALISMRDDPDDSPIPKKFEPSDYYQKKIIETQKELECFHGMTEAEKVAFGIDKKKSEIKRYEEYLEREQTENNKLDSMAAQIKAWSPPTKDHNGLKSFMLQQIEISKNDLSYSHDNLNKARNKTAIEYYVAAVSGAKKSINYYIEKNKREIERTNERNEWIEQLRESI